MIPDFRDESCTYLMLRLKFPKSGYAVDVITQDEKDTYLITLTPSVQK